MLLEFGGMHTPSPILRRWLHLAGEDEKSCVGNGVAVRDCSPVQGTIVSTWMPPCVAGRTRCWMKDI